MPKKAKLDFNIYEAPHRFSRADFVREFAQSVCSFGWTVQPISDIVKKQTPLLWRAANAVNVPDWFTSGYSTSRGVPVHSNKLSALDAAGRRLSFSKILSTHGAAAPDADVVAAIAVRVRCHTISPAQMTITADDALSIIMGHVYLRDNAWDLHRMEDYCQELLQHQAELAVVDLRVVSINDELNLYDVHMYRCPGCNTVDHFYAQCNCGTDEPLQRV